MTQETLTQVKIQVDTVKNIVILKERKGKNASFERSLLKAWSTVPGFECAADALKECDQAAG